MDGPDPEALLREVTWLRRLAHSLVADAATADDLAGETLAAWSAARTKLHSVRGWLATVLRHHAARRHRRDQLRELGERAAARSERLPPVDDAIATAQLHRAVVDAVLALAEPYRSAIVLRYLEDLPLHEVARRLQVPAETARTRIKRGLDHLRQKFDRRHGGRAAWTTLLLRQFATTRTLSLSSLLMGTKFLLGAGVVVAAALVYLLLPKEPVTSAPPPRPQLAAAALPAPSEAPAGGQQRQLETAPAPPAAAAPAVTAIATGRVVDEATSLALAGVTVGWFRLDADTPRTGATATTDAGGRFTLATMAPAPQDHCVLLLRAPEHALATQQLGNPEDKSAAPLRFDVGDILLPPGTAVTGTVVDAEGAPAPWTPLFLCLFSYWTGEGRIVRLEQALPAGSTDAEGRFHLTDRLLPERPPPLLLAAGSRGVGYADLADLKRERSEQRVDVHLQPATTLRVRVADANGQSVAGALVVAEPRFLPLCLPGTHPIRVETVPQLADCFCARTDADGRALLRPLLLPGALPAAFTLRAEAADRDTSVVPVQLPRADEVQIVLPSRHPLRLQGHVRAADGRPIAGARVAAHWRAGAEERTGDDGAFALSLARGDGPLSVTAAARGWFPARRSLQPDAAAAEVTVDFILAPALELCGSVVDQDGKGVAGANVWLGGGEAQGTPTEADGAFRMPVPPAAARVLLVQPPEPSSAWLGSVEHLLLPGQAAVTLVLARLPAGAARLEVELVDPEGKPLEPRSSALVRLGDGDGLWHPATGIIGRITAANLAPGTWSLRVAPTSGCELATVFTVPADAEVVRLRLAQSASGSVHGEVVFEPKPDQLPDTVELGFAPGGQTARFAAGPGQELLAEGSRLRLCPKDGLGFAVTGVDPTRPLGLVAQAGPAGGEAEVRVPPGGDVPVRVPVQTLATLKLASAQPFLFDRLQLQVRRPGAGWGELQRFEGLSGRTDLVAWPLPAGSHEWRLRLPTQGDDNRAGAAWRQGACTLAPGATAVVDVSAR